ncbi:TetR/AcrR family transcriptional regulator [Tessaracoccus flavus]|jgi:AcrR family transcriptional regulator|uniref:TetR/AcrR family transcriptional regulator n=1 Tax=Tessaracoccus flavus TaxID=1610493 RepID=UPI00089D85CA|nr:TetR/AcrR family transcriptional regulator [Tessaracoccus flavus]SDY37633.1 transcriptional regulator, TetR family [Tessaracoccus flavus]
MARPKVHDERLAEVLLEQSAVIVAKGGPDALSLRKLTDAVGTSTSAVYSLYGSREALLLAVYERALASFERSAQELPVTDRPMSDLFRMGREYRRWALSNPQLYPVMFMGPAGSGPEQRRALAMPTIDRLIAALRRCIEAGELRDAESIEVMACQLWATVHGHVSLELMGLLTPEVTGRSSEEIDRSFDDLLNRSVATWRVS